MGILRSVLILSASINLMVLSFIGVGDNVPLSTTLLLYSTALLVHFIVESSNR